VLIWRALDLSSMMYEILPGVIMAYIGTIVTSLLDKPPAKEIQDEFEKVRKMRAAS
jgi:Na+(H+)/acetate symporter ActP